MMVARRFLISGRVQGVGFRWFAIERASLEGVTGWVRNLSGGEVEVVAEGDADAMERFERAVRRGPGRARVDDVTTDVLTPTARFATFTARN
jgi:acylphosphatase